MVIMNTQPVKTEGWDSLKHSVIMKINALQQLAPMSTVEQPADAISDVPTINMATEETVASNSVIDRTSNIPMTNTMTNIPTMANNCHATITFPLTSVSPTISSSQWTQCE